MIATVLIAILTLALLVAACIIVDQAVANHELTCDCDEQRQRADRLGLAVVERHVIISELEEALSLHEQAQKGALATAIVRLPVLKTPTGIIYPN